MERYNSVRIAKSSPLGADEADPALLAPPPSLGVLNDKRDDESDTTAVEQSPWIQPQPEPVIQPVYAAAPVTVLRHVKEEPAWVDCPFCKARRLTRVTKYEEDPRKPSWGDFWTCCCCGAQSVTNPADVPTRHYCSTCSHLLVTRPKDGRPVQVEQPDVNPELVPSMYASNAQGNVPPNSGGPRRIG